MDQREQRFVTELLSLLGLGGKAIYAQLLGTLADGALSLSTVSWWSRRFKTRNTSCEDAEWPSRPMIIIGDILRKFLAKYPFDSAKIIPRHFGVSVSTVKENLVRELGFKKHTRRWVPYFPDTDPKNYLRLSSIQLLKLLRERGPCDLLA
jgi:transposase